MRWKGFPLGNVLCVFAAAAMAVALFLVFVEAPREAIMGDLQRIFYFHVSASWNGYLALLVTFVGSLVYLRRREPRWDALALSSGEIGLVFVTEGIVTGSIWAKPTWGTWWTWDPRLTTSAVLWLMSASYLMLRRAIEEENRRAQVAAVYSIISFVIVPLNAMAIRWWRTIHPVVLGSPGFHLGSTMLVTLLVCVVAFTLLYFALLSCRLHLQRMTEQVHQLSRR